VKPFWKTILRWNRRRFEWFVGVGLIPIYMRAVSLYGLRVLVILSFTVLAGAITDVLVNSLKDRSLQGSGHLNGLAWLLMPLALPPGIPLWMSPVALVFALIWGRHLFGGWGFNLLNTVALGAVFLQLSYPAYLVVGVVKPFEDPHCGFSRYSAGMVFPGSVLADVTKDQEKAIIPLQDFLIGRLPGLPGEAWQAYLLLLGLVFCLLGITDYRYPIGALIGTALFSALGVRFFPGRVAVFEHQVLAGAFLPFLVLFSADVWALPRIPAVRWVAGLLFAFFTISIRSCGNGIEGVFFAALLTGIFTPLLDRLIGPLFHRCLLEAR
jgi:Na+-translocating ferredoxin:NAD+ oxidoreductase RnfD subunit